jgi:hypothetical protein
VLVAAADDVAARVGEQSDDLEAARRRSPVHRVGVVTLLAGVHVQAALQQQLDGRRLGVLRRDVEQRVLVRLRPGVELVRVLLEQRAQHRDVAVSRGREEPAIDRQRVHVRLPSSDDPSRRARLA